MSKPFTYIHYYFLLLGMLVSGTILNAKTASTTDSLSSLSSIKLMEYGRNYFEQRDADNALKCFTLVSKRHFDISDPDIMLGVRALNNIACVYKYFNSDYIKAYDYFTQAYHLCEEAGDQDFMPVIMVNFGDLLYDSGISYSSQSLSQQAQEIFDTCWEQAHKNKNGELMATVFFNLANQNYELKLNNYKALFSKDIPDSTPDIKYVRLQYKGIEQLQQGNYSEARKCFEQQLPMVSTRWEPERDTLATYMSIAYTYRMEGDHSQEIKYLEQALQLAEDYQVSDQAASILHFLTEARAQELSQRQRIQQITIGFIGILLLVVIASALLLWSKNRQLHIRNKSLFEKNQQLLFAESETRRIRKEQEDNKYSRSSLSNEQRETLSDRIQQILDTPDVICQSEFSLGKLAKMADSNTTYISQVINEKYGTAFSNVLASCRIKEACRRISNSDGRYGQMTIEAIAIGVGFKSRTSFINAFKREVGLTPSEYMRMAQLSE